MGLRLSDLDAKTAARIQAQMDAQAPAKVLSTVYHFVTAFGHIKGDREKVAALADAWRAAHPLTSYRFYVEEVWA